MENMCKASKYAQSLQSVIDTMVEDREKLIKSLSHYDRELSSVYHEIEESNANACSGYYYYKRMQTILRKRRVCKHELSKMTTLFHNLRMKDVQSNLKKAKKNVAHSDQGNKHYTKDWNMKLEDFEQEFSIQ